ncbi:MAG: flavodoxin family protein [Proteobacteria bacterium]|nr:flavodoxin family protein [Pseudomonadota bacterium]MBU1649312.1 flavodoxin family protein [Pseudomonadota bacterium]MBU1986344.1 flavodoxin family protein [Pseudomonadota bacterium]
MKILGISGSPIKNSNTDRALKIVLESTSLKSEFIKLSDYNFGPCDACLGCIKTNRCIKKDDGVMLAEKTYKADAVIIAGFTPYSSLDSRTKAYMERLYPLRHRHGLMAGKPGAAIITSAIPYGHEGKPSAAEIGIQAVKDFMMEEGMKFIAGVSLLGNVPCVRCGQDGQCQMSSLKMIHGQDATPESVGINDFENDPQKVAELQQLGEAIRNSIY